MAIREDVAIAGRVVAEAVARRVAVRLRAEVRDRTRSDQVKLALALGVPRAVVRNAATTSAVAQATAGEVDPRRVAIARNVGGTRRGIDEMDLRVAIVVTTAGMIVVTTFLGAKINAAMTARTSLST